MMEKCPRCEGMHRALLSAETRNMDRERYVVDLERIIREVLALRDMPPSLLERIKLVCGGSL